MPEKELLKWQTEILPVQWAGTRGNNFIFWVLLVVGLLAMIAVGGDYKWKPSFIAAMVLYTAFMLFLAVSKLRELSSRKSKTIPMEYVITDRGVYRKHLGSNGKVGALVNFNIFWDRLRAPLLGNIANSPFYCPFNAMTKVRRENDLIIITTKLSPFDIILVAKDNTDQVVETIEEQSGLRVVVN